jgi:hypothetical protein
LRYCIEEWLDTGFPKQDIPVKIKKYMKILNEKQQFKPPFELGHEYLGNVWFREDDIARDCQGQ